MAWIRNRPVGLVHRDTALAEDGYTLFCPIRATVAWPLDPEGRFVSTSVRVDRDSGSPFHLRFTRWI